MIIGRIMLGVFIGSVSTYTMMTILDQELKARNRARIFVTLLPIVPNIFTCI